MARGGEDRPDGIQKITDGMMVILLGSLFITAFLPVIVSQFLGLNDNPMLSGWSGLEAFQSVGFIIPMLLIAGVALVAVRMFSRNRE